MVRNPRGLLLSPLIRDLSLFPSLDTLDCVLFYRFLSMGRKWAKLILGHKLSCGCNHGCSVVATTLHEEKHSG